MSTALVPADNMAAVEALEPGAREAAVTHMLAEARGWLAHAMEASEPASIANFKAWTATVVEATKQLGLSKEIQMDAVEMVRRAEQGVGKAVRKGQEEGTVRTRLDNLRPGGLEAVHNGFEKASPTDYAKSDELTGNGAGIYDLVDGVSDEQFEEALAEAKSEGNLSRANVVRKIKGEASKLSGEKRLERIAELAVKGWTSDQIAKDLGHTEEYTRTLAREADIEIPADRTMRGMHRHIDHDRIASHTVTALEGLVLGLQLLNLNEVDHTQINEWATSLNNSLRALNRFHKQIKEMATND